MAVRPIPAASSYLSGPCNGFALSLAGAYPARTPVLGSRRPSGSTPERRRADHSEARIRSSDGADGGEASAASPRALIGARRSVARRSPFIGPPTPDSNFPSLTSLLSAQQNKIYSLSGLPSTAAGIFLVCLLPAHILPARISACSTSTPILRSICRRSRCASLVGHN